MLQLSKPIHNANETRSILEWIKDEMRTCNEALDIHALGISLDDMMELMASIDVKRPHLGCKCRLIVSQQAWPLSARKQWEQIMNRGALCEVDVKVRSYDFAPSFCIIRINNKMVTGNYISDASGSKTLIMLERGNGTTFDTFMGYFNSLWGYMTKPVPAAA